jgi:hypothetical protein
MKQSQTIGGHVSGSGTLHDAPTPPGVGGDGSSDFNTLYAENCRLRLDLGHREAELSGLRREVQRAAEQAEKQRAHLQRRIDSLIREIRRQDALLHPPVEFTSNEHGMWSWRCSGGPGCPGWVGRGEHSETAAWAAYENHVRRDHKEAS